MMSILCVVVMALVLVSVGGAATGSSYNDTPALFAGTHSVSVDAGDRDGNRAADLTSFPPILALHRPLTPTIPMPGRCLAQ